jgi:hypothetical protein
MTNVWVLKESSEGFVGRTKEAPIYRNCKDVEKAIRFDSKNKAAEWANGNRIGDVTPIQIKLDIPL